MNLANLRMKSGLTQLELAEKIGRVQTAISKWETGESNPPTIILPKLAEILGCSIEDFFKDKEEDTTNDNNNG